MKWFKPRKWVMPKRPVRLTLIIFLVLCALVAGTAPFISDIPRLIYLAAGIGYSFILSVLGVGIILLGEKTAKLLLKVVGLILLVLLLVIYSVALYGARTEQSVSAIHVLSIAISVGHVIAWGLLAVVFFMAAIGWKRYLGERRNTQQPDTADSASPHG